MKIGHDFDRFVDFVVNGVRELFETCFLSSDSEFMIDDFVVDFAVELTIVGEDLSHSAELSDNEIVLLDEILNGHTATQKSVIDGHHILQFRAVTGSLEFLQLVRQ